ncbi:MAG: metal ABC transporter permease [Deltaproteobacteria bacterium]|nr:metal ABC transporter permease [Deltaproteobacteria bacterium]
MNDIFIFLSAPFFMCLILVGMHCYLGIHVLARGIVFIDLALAQVAALGSILAYANGFEHNTLEDYLISLGCTFVAAAFLTLANQYKNKISQEALIGLVYAMTSAATILLLDQMSHGSEHLKYSLVGQLLWVDWNQVYKVIGIYTLVASMHYYWRGPLLQNSYGKNEKWQWDFIFYFLFGIVITSSVHIAGILLVFAFLIVPAVVSAFFFQRIYQKLLFGWALGFFLCTIGMLLSYFLDKPAGAVIVITFTIVPILLILGLAVKRRIRPT